MLETEPLSERATELMRQFPGPIVLPATGAKWHALVCAVLCALGVFNLVVQPHRVPAPGWIVLLVSLAFGLFAAQITLRLIAGRIYLVLTADGFAYSDVWGGERRHRWTDTSNFQVISFGKGGNAVAFQIGRRRRSKISLFLFPADAWLPDRYGLAFRDLAALMTVWRRCALT